METGDEEDFLDEHIENLTSTELSKFVVIGALPSADCARLSTESRCEVKGEVCSLPQEVHVLPRDSWADQRPGGQSSVVTSHMHVHTALQHSL